MNQFLLTKEMTVQIWNTKVNFCMPGLYSKSFYYLELIFLARA